MPKGSMREDLPTASLKDRALLIAEVVLPTLAKGPLIRRPRAERMAERLGLDLRAVRRLERLRERYGAGPVLVPLPGRLHAVVLSPEHATRILDGTPDPFTPATNEKRRALSHFEPGNSLISLGAERTERRRFQEEALEAGRPVHSMAAPFLDAAREEARRILSEAGDRLDWPRFLPGWYALARRIVLGKGARDDHGLTDLLGALRRRGNWVMLLRQRRGKIDELRARIDAHLARAEPGSLAERIAALPKTPTTAPADQVMQHLFAFDPAGMATFRALALLAAHPEALAAARAEAAGGAGPMLPFHRATILESLRLWPTTPAILRQAVRDVEWSGGTIPKDTSLLVFASFFHRNDALPFAHRFAPEVWLDEERGVRVTANGATALVPFSRGPGQCPAADLVPMVGSAVLATLALERTPRLADPRRLRADRPLPGTLDHNTLAFDLASA